MKKNKVNYFPRREELENLKPCNVTVQQWKTYLDVIAIVPSKKLLVTYNGYRRYLFELQYFGADLNKFINLHCRRDMTVNNIDCITYRDNDVSFSLTGEKIMRIIEVKKQNEKLKETQNKLLIALADIASQNNNQLGQYDLQIYMIRSNSPKFTENKIYDYLTGDTYLLGEEKLKKFLNYQYELNDEDFIPMQLTFV